MRRYFIVASTFAVLGVAVACVAPRPADAFTANANGVAKTLTATNTIMEVKHKGTPPGWHHGRKVGWNGRNEPPGQAKKP
jgi:hypothetical protein